MLALGGGSRFRLPFGCNSFDLANPYWLFVIAIASPLPIPLGGRSRLRLRSGCTLLPIRGAQWWLRRPRELFVFADPHAPSGPLASRLALPVLAEQDSSVCVAARCRSSVANFELQALPFRPQGPPSKLEWAASISIAQMALNSLPQPRRGTIQGRVPVLLLVP